MKNFKNIKNFKIKAGSILGALLVVFILGCGQNQKRKTTETRMEAGKIRVAILVYPDVELLDFAGPSEVFGNSKYFQVYTVAAVPGKLSTKSSTLSINPDFTIANAPQPDILVIPGGPMKNIELIGADQQVMKWINKVHEKTKLTMSVCTGAGILSKAGLLDGKTATTHSGAIDTLQKLTPMAKFIGDVRFVEDGKIITTAGVSAGIDGALHVVAKLKGLKEALFITAVLEYEKWKPEDGKVINAMNMSNMQHRHETAGIRHKAMPNINGEDTDVVCGMTVAKSSAKYFSNYQGKDYHFCSASCKKLFDKNSALYASKN